MEPIILASSSPRRRELLSQAGIPFKLMPGNVDEAAVELSGTPAQKAERLAFVKAQHIAEKVDKGIVLGADTIVVCDDEIFGKPADAKDAERMLESLSGREHLVITGVVLIDAGNGRKITGNEITRVKFAKLSKEELKAYIKTGEYAGKAGAYAIQGRAALLVESLNGCYSNVVGLPLRKVGNMLLEFGVKVLE